MNKNNSNKIIKALKKVIASLSFQEEFEKKYSSCPVSGGGSWVFLGAPEAYGKGNRYDKYCYKLNDKNGKEIARLYFTLWLGEKSIRFALDTEVPLVVDLTPAKVQFGIESRPWEEEFTVDTLFNAIKPSLDSVGKKLLSTRQKKFKGKF